MELIPWTYNNPRVSIKSNKKVVFSFAGKTVTLSQNLDANVNVNRNTNCKIWDGAFLLAKYLENKQAFPNEFWHNKRCLELGSGCGLVGIVAWLMGADVTLTDLPEATGHTRACVSLNTCGARDSSIRVLDYPWASHIPSNHFAQIDYIFGSDVVYQPCLCKKLVESLLLIMDNSTVALISYKKRGLGEEVFFELLIKHNFVYEQVDSIYHSNEFLNSDYTLFSIKKL